MHDPLEIRIAPWLDWIISLANNNLSRKITAHFDQALGSHDSTLLDADEAPRSEVFFEDSAQTELAEREDEGKSPAALI